MDTISRNSKRALFRLQISDLETNFRRKFDRIHCNEFSPPLIFMNQWREADFIGLSKRLLTFRITKIIIMKDNIGKKG